MTGRRTAQVLLALGGLIAWAVQFTLIYGATSTLCGRGWADSTLFGFGIVHAVIMATTLVALAPTVLMLVMLLRAYRHADKEGDSCGNIVHDTGRHSYQRSLASGHSLAGHARIDPAGLRLEHFGEVDPDRR